MIGICTLKKGDVMTFASFLAQVDDLFMEKYTLGLDDFPDYVWRDLWEDGYTSLEAFLEYVEDLEEYETLDDNFRNEGRL